MADLIRKFSNQPIALESNRIGRPILIESRSFAGPYVLCNRMIFKLHVTFMKTTFVALFGDGIVQVAFMDSKVPVALE